MISLKERNDKVIPMLAGSNPGRPFAMRPQAVAPLAGRSSAVALDGRADVALRIGFVFLLISLGLSFGRLTDLLGLLTGVAFPATVVTVIALLLALITGRLHWMAGTSVGVRVLVFTAWMMVCSALSVWKTGALNTLLHEWFPSLALCLACSLIVTMRQCRTAAAAIAAANLMVAVASFFLGTMKESRLSFGESTLGNANDLSMILLLEVPFLLVPLFASRGSRLVKGISVLSALLVIAVMFRTGSRSGLLSLAAMTLMLFLCASAQNKIRFVIVAPLLVVILLLAVPQQTLQRYATTFSDPVTYADLGSEAYASKELRQSLLRDSLRSTAQHAVFGVGPGVFMADEADQATKTGKPAKWRVSHNSFTQVSSEMGIPGFLMYLAALWATVGNVLWCRRHRREDPTGVASGLSLALLLSLAGLIVNLFFSSNAYMPFLPVLMGLSVVFRGAIARALTKEPRVPVVAMPPRPSAPSLSPAPAVPLPAHASPQYTYRFLGRPRRAGS